MTRERPSGVADVVRALRRGKGRPRPELQREAEHLPADLRGLPSPTLNRPVLIGQAPGPRTHPDLALFPAPPASAGGRLFAWTGLTVEQYMNTFDRVNLLYEHPGKYPGTAEDRFPRPLARVAAQAMRPWLFGRTVLLVGRDVANAFEVPPETPWMQWQTMPVWRIRYATIPHPSGRNHWYNDRANLEAVQQFLREWIASCLFSPE